MENFKITRPAETNARRSPLLPSKIHPSRRSYLGGKGEQTTRLEHPWTFAGRSQQDLRPPSRERIRFVKLNEDAFGYIEEGEESGGEIARSRGLKN